MSPRYRITPEGRPPEPSDAELARYRNSERLIFNYQRALRSVHRKPLYKDPKAFLAILLIVLLALFITEVVDKEKSVRPDPLENNAR
jgi:hypothetical protein